MTFQRAKNIVCKNIYNRYIYLIYLGQPDQVPHVLEVTGKALVLFIPFSYVNKVFPVVID